MGSLGPLDSFIASGVAQPPWGTGQQTDSDLLRDTSVLRTVQGTQPALKANPRHAQPSGARRGERGGGGGSQQSLPASNRP